tara:strand:- start:191 stop:802 length:612 start_codon:yes stop_codon:yes gene_type:complete
MPLIDRQSFTWGPYLWKSHLRDEETQELLKRAHACHGKKTAEPILPFNFGNEWYFTEEDGEYFKRIWNKYLKAYLEGYAVHNNLPPMTDAEFRCWDLNAIWANFYQKNDMAALHNHVGDLSFVIYLDIPEYTNSIDLDKIKGTAPPPGSITFTWGDDKKVFIPATGDLYMFPSNLFHMVMPFKTDVTRISMSGNIFFQQLFHG